MKSNIQKFKISARAWELLRTLSRTLDNNPLAMHVTLRTDVTPEKWIVGFTPESTILNAPSEVLDLITAKRYNGVLVVVDGRVPRKAKTLDIDLEADTDRFTVKIY